METARPVESMAGTHAAKTTLQSGRRGSTRMRQGEAPVVVESSLDARQSQGGGDGTFMGPTPCDFLEPSFQPLQRLPKESAANQ